MPATKPGESNKSDCAVTTVGEPDRVPETSVISQTRLSASDLETLAEIRAELDCLDSGPTEMADGISQASESEDLASTSEAVLEGNVSTEGEEVPGRVPTVVRRGPTLTTSRDVHCSTPSVVVIQRPGRVTSSTSGSYVTSSVRSVMATPTPTTTKRAASGNCGPVIAKVIITGNPNSGQSRPIVSMGSRTESAPSTQHVKIVGSGQSGVTTLLASPTKAITLAQAQQMGLLSPAKVQQILPRATVKQTHDTGTVLTTTASTGQMIRIPATQNVVTTTSSNVHQIQVPGRQLQYVRLVNASEGTARVTTASTPITPSTTTPTIRTQPSLRVVPIAPATEENRGARRVSNTNQRPQQRSNPESARPRSSSTPRPGQPQPRPSLEPNGIRPKKPCNCTKSQCLKLYCDCFANGEFCHLCNCANCSNNLEHEEERQRAIKSCLERNPNAFRPKIGKGHVGDERRHNKGCNCKRSGCLKNYCECYEAKIPCSGMCKCVGCRNVEESPSEKKTLRDLAEAAEVRVRQQAAVKSRLSAQVREVMHPGPILGRKPRALLTTAVIEATCQCMLAQAKGVHNRYGNVSLSKIQESVIKEFGKCLIRIVESAEGAESR